ncbi:hypothetical protein DFH94DRAFT_848994 [Russula ochroleuca]|uniref:Uncharacterized protein n=1 Tax=Russula ochroleuca TaxID=152965 RepID=A0A9P5MN35_9AGAM|nr:hypothetical protein DFH94DRAFT_848994 [Russula ochroleuca]
MKYNGMAGILQRETNADGPWHGVDFDASFGFPVTKASTAIPPTSLSNVTLDSLSTMQRKAFDIVRAQLLMVVVVSALKVIAPTGIAAANIRGSTNFSLLSLLSHTLAGRTPPSHSDGGGGRQAAHHQRILVFECGDDREVGCMPSSLTPPGRSEERTLCSVATPPSSLRFDLQRLMTHSHTQQMGEKSLSRSSSFKSKQCKSMMACNEARSDGARGDDKTGKEEAAGKNTS